MSLSETRLGANATGLPGPAPLPPLISALSRRVALFGAVTATGALAGSAARGMGASALSPNDARLAAIAAELQAVHDRVDALSAAHDRAEELPEWRALLDRFAPLEAEMEATPADTLAGVLAKARASRVPPVFDCHNEIADSMAADLLRLDAGALT